MPKTRPQPTIEAQDRSQEVARDIGRQLREARLARGETVDAVADQLRIRPSYVEALETGELSRIPGRPYVVGFLRSYAGHLELDGEGLVASLKSSAARVASPPELVYREPIAESRRGTAVMLTASALLAAAVYGGYYMIYHVDRGGSEPVVAEVPGEMARLATDTLRRADTNRAAITAGPAAPAGAVRVAADGSTAARAAPAAATRGPIEALVADDEDPVAARAASVLPPEIHSSTPTAASAAPASATELLAALESDRINAARLAAVPEGEAEGRLALVARETTWVQVRSTGRDYVRTRTMQRGERFTLPDRADLALWTANAGGLELVVDGESRGQLGSAGEVVRNRPLAPDLPGGGPARGG